MYINIEYVYFWQPTRWTVRLIKLLYIYITSEIRLTYVLLLHETVLNNLSSE